jgi:hypothetical protein
MHNSIVPVSKRTVTEAATIHLWFFQNNGIAFAAPHQRRQSEVNEKTELFLSQLMGTR